VREFEHNTVLRDATVQALQPSGGGRYLDGTLGGGGHTEALLQASGPDGVVVGIDRDPHALDAAALRLADFGPRFQAIRGRFGNMAQLAEPWAPLDGIVLDLGVSSPQLDHADRGFSFQRDGPVDMRMDPESGESAAELIARLDADALADIIYQYGDEPRSRRIARAVVAGGPWTSTTALAGCIARSSGYKRSRTHPATRTFQALRIAVNDELGELERALDAGLELLRPGGRMAVISFHSLEDRIVKQRFAALSGKDTQRDEYGNPMTPPRGRLVHRRGIAGRDADPDNPRARSARLRVLQTLPPQ
jgi:16S rRNA (cytosine1402-N4)-methyltransferase